MKAAVFAALLVAFGAAHADKYTQGYVKSNGTYVQGYYSTSPNSTRTDNYSAQGNVNPYTGSVGTVNPYTAPQPVYTPPPAMQPMQPVKPLDWFNMSQPGNKKF
jgi:hypothetical protein